MALGGRWSTETQALRDFVSANAAADQKEDNVNLGVQLGFNYQTGPIVFGAEAEFSSFEKGHTETRGPLKQTTAATTSYTFTNSLKPDNMVATKAKLGLTTGSTLFYATGGWAWTKVEFGTGITSSANYLRKVRSRRRPMASPLAAGSNSALLGAYQPG